MKEYRYKLSSSEESSNKYGACEVCGKYCTEVFYQSEERHYEFDHEGKHYEGWTQHGCHALFGHKSCLESKQEVNKNERRY
jgi:hypothetical protein